MLKNIVVLITAFVCAQVFAEPMKMASKSELASAKKAAEGLLTSGVSADQVFEYAEEAKKSAEKYQLYCTAFKLYAKEEKAEEAAKVIDKIQSEFIGAPDKDIVSMIEQYAKKLAKDNEELGAALSISKMRASAASQLSKAKKELKKNPNSVEIKYQIAEAYAVLGDWKSALKQFKDAGGSVWQIASEEASGVVSAKIAAFWWDYKPRSKFNAEPAFKAHSAAIYEKLLKDGELSVLEKATAESRIEQAGKLGASKPKSELDKLKKICNTKGLVHCWRFNGDLKDCVGKCDAPKEFSGTIRATDFLYDGEKALTLGTDILPKGTEELTIEVWATQLGVRQGNWGCVCVIGSENRYGCIYQGWNCGNNTRAAESVIGWIGGFSREFSGVAPFDFNTEYHIVIVFRRTDDKPFATYIKQNAQTGETISRRTVIAGKRDWTLAGFDSARLSIGGNVKASYNEVRIWTRALSEEELTQNAIKFHKAGETMKK